MSPAQHPQGLSTLNAYQQNGAMTYSLRIPSKLGNKIAHLKGGLFSCELTEEGILFRLIQDPVRDGETPGWAS